MNDFLNSLKGELNNMGSWNETIEKEEGASSLIMMMIEHEKFILTGIIG
jgi:hypothetical protein